MYQTITINLTPKETLTKMYEAISFIISKKSENHNVNLGEVVKIHSFLNKEDFQSALKCNPISDISLLDLLRTCCECNDVNIIKSY
jgi:hypothetical protein